MQTVHGLDFNHALFVSAINTGLSIRRVNQTFFKLSKRDFVVNVIRLFCMS